MARAKVQAMTASALQAPGFQRPKVSNVIVTALNDGLTRISAAPQTQLATTRNNLRRCNPSAMSAELTDMTTVA
jgi:hypothetical protein